MFKQLLVKIYYSLLLSALNYKTPKIRRLSTVSSVVAAAGHAYSTRWHWYWQDKNNKWQSYDTPNDGHAVSTTSSQCLEREYMAGKKSPFPLIYYNQFLLSHIYFKPFILLGIISAGHAIDNGWMFVFRSYSNMHSWDTIKSAYLTSIVFLLKFCTII